MRQSWVAFLRGMNVGGHRITNAALIQIASDLGLGGVAAFRASGNLMFTSSGSGPDAAPETSVEALLESGLEKALGYGVPTCVLSAGELRSALEGQPWTEQQRAERGKVQLTFLKHLPSDAQVAQALGLASGEDLLSIQGRALYWLPITGISSSKLDTSALLRILGMQTTRTEGTCRSILKKLEAM